MKNLLVAQSGGPTAAINATVAGVVSCAQSSGMVDTVYGAINGIEGVLEERFVNLGETLCGSQQISLLMQTPAAALGSCRFKLKDLKKDASQFEKIIEVFRRHEIRYFIYIGGNDSMDTVDKLSAYCTQQGIDDIHVIGAPKTIDNDLVGTDHCPGFGSAAKYIAATFAELERDCHVYTTKAVTIVEVMGRNAGWLTAASALARVNGGDGPSLIYLCESVFDTERFLADVREQLQKKDSVVVAISEGIHDTQGHYISEQVQSGALDQFGHSYIAGSAKVLEELVRTRIGCKVRSIELNLMQRCAGHIASATDLNESRMLGMKACQCAIEGNSGLMASVERISDNPYRVRYMAVPVCDVSNAEKKVPMEWITPDGHDVTEEMMVYLQPLILGEPEVQYQNGIPLHLFLY
ncbi:MAG: 6-phosphofructokinase [Fusicatenibacter sp.]|nr:6-phosphofructokinase [Fusicatenibacter sp.]